jgi:crotonobetainyl-CoA:carnitine CoA-transferase CaiB-like acyl-CoA transferase
VTEAPLAGVKVLELARVLAGPWAGQILADFGAEVIKVERRGAGDETRTWGPPFVAAVGGGDLGAAYFHAANRGKRAIAVDFDNAEDLARVKALAAEADVVIENFKVGGLVKYGLDHASLRARHPALVYCSITGFGQDGPYARRAGYDFLIQGMGGIMSLTGEADAAPQKPGLAYADLFSGTYAAFGILAALRRRDTTGQGGHLDISLLDVQVGVLANQAMNYLVSGTAPGRMGNAHPNLTPYGVFSAADGDLVIAVGNDGQFARLCAALGRPDLVTAPDFATNPARLANRAALTAVLAELIGARPRADLIAALEAGGVPAGPIHTVDQVFADPQVRHRGMAIAVAQPAALAGAVPGLRNPILLDGVPLTNSRPAPGLGEHDAEIAASGWSPPDRR